MKKVNIIRRRAGGEPGINPNALFRQVMSGMMLNQQLPMNNNNMLPGENVSNLWGGIGNAQMNSLLGNAGPSVEENDDNPEDEELGVAETYADYKPSKLKIGNRHPDPVVETASLASVLPPEVYYNLHLPDEVINVGALSALQLEAVVYACQQHEHFLETGERAGYLVGDGAGVGKGRTIAGIIFENYLCGRKKAIWVSVSTDLKYDAERDLKDIGANKINVYPLNKFKYGGGISSSVNKFVRKGVIFSTYSSLIGASSRGGRFNTRLKQILDWCGKDFDGVIAFDESHRAKNLCPVRNSRKPTKTGQIVFELQQQLPKARIVYASATGASEPKNMAYMARLSVWGPGTPFRAFCDFATAIEKRGIGAMEIVAMDMKLRGTYIARQLSFQGVVFSVEEVPLTPTFIEVYDDSVQLWVEAMEKFMEAIELMMLDPLTKNVIWAQFWAAHQRFFKYLCISSKVAHAVEVAKESVRCGKCVVIGLQSTGEARTLGQLEKDDGELTEFVSTAKGVFQTLVEKHFPAPDEMNELWGLSTTSSLLVEVKMEMGMDEQPCSSSGAVKRKPVRKAAETAVKKIKIEDSDSETEYGSESSSDSYSPDSEASTDDLYASSDLESDDDAKKKKQKNIKLKRKGTGESDIRIKTEPLDSDASTDDLYASSNLESDDDAKKKIKKKIKLESKETETGISQIRIKKEPLDSDATTDDLYASSDLESDDIKKYAKTKKKKQKKIKLECMETDESDNEAVRQFPSQAASASAWQMKAQLLEKIEQLGNKLPPNTLDQLIDELGGPEVVAEMTGRKGRVVQRDQGQIQYESRSETDVSLETVNLTEKQRFMNGDKHIAIISEAASSGISLQSDRRAKNQRRRVHITLELPWSADRAIQQFGRTHRCNQVNAPEYVFLISDLAGEHRFASIVAKRLESLGALTHGDRRATETRDLSRFHIDNKYGRGALESVMKYIIGERSPMVPPPAGYVGNFRSDVADALVGVGLIVNNEEDGGFPTLHPNYNNMSKFLNRILGMTVKLQNALFQYFVDTLNALVTHAKKTGRFDLGILDLGEAGSGELTLLNTEKFQRKHAFGQGQIELHELIVERGMSWTESQKMYVGLLGKNEGYYLSRQIRSGKQTAVLAVADPNNSSMSMKDKDKNSKSSLYTLYRPNTGLQVRRETLGDVQTKFTKVKPTVAERHWVEQYESSKRICTHAFWGGNCKQRVAGYDCEIGLRSRTYHVLSGAVLLVWDEIERVLTHNTVVAKMQIVRVKSADGMKMVGILIPNSCAVALSVAMEAASAKEIADMNFEMEEDEDDEGDEMWEKEQAWIH